MGENWIDISKRIISDGESNLDGFSNEKKLAYYIMQQRYENLRKFVSETIKVKYNLDDDYTECLIEKWFHNNNLSEINFIGTDFFSNAMFVKHRVPFLYRSVGKDNNKDNAANNDDTDSTIKRMFREALDQIKSGKKSELYSYTKCFGRVLFKYLNFMENEGKHIIEIRKNAWVNMITIDGLSDCSFQEFDARLINNNNVFFSIDMSNARDNDVKNLKEWFDVFLEEKQDYIPLFDDIFDPIGDAEVVCNFTNGSENVKNVQCELVTRKEIGEDEFCILMYWYSIMLGKKLEEEQKIHTLVEESIKNFYIEGGQQLFTDNMKNWFEKYKDFVEKYLNDEQTEKPEWEKLLSFFGDNIDWDLEVKYMKRHKHFGVYKENNQEYLTGSWKEICIGAVRAAL